MMSSHEIMEDYAKFIFSYTQLAIGSYTKFFLEGTVYDMLWTYTVPSDRLRH